MSCMQKIKAWAAIRAVVWQAPAILDPLALRLVPDHPDSMAIIKRLLRADAPYVYHQTTADSIVLADDYIGLLVIAHTPSLVQLYFKQGSGHVWYDIEATKVILGVVEGHHIESVRLDRVLDYLKEICVHTHDELECISSPLLRTAAIAKLRYRQYLIDIIAHAIVRQ